MWSGKFLRYHRIFLQKYVLVSTVCIIFFIQWTISLHKYESKYYIQSRINKNTGLNTYLTFEDKYSLCAQQGQYSDKPVSNQNCPKNGIVTAIQSGRLGNQIWEYVSVWLAAQKTGLTPVIPECIKLRLEELFDDLKLTTFNDISHCVLKTTNISFRDVKAPWIYKNQSIILPVSVNEPRLLAERVSDVRKLFTIKKQLVHRSQEILQSAARLVKTPVQTFIGVHVRRTDYLQYLKVAYNASVAVMNYFKSAMNYFESKYPQSIFIIISDDSKWCMKQFQSRNNVYIAGKYHESYPELDIALMASCNHTIIDFGTYGQWGALLAGGETVFYKVHETYSSDELGQYLDNWHTI